MAYCGRCGASVNTFGNIAHWGVCNALGREIKFRAPNVTLPKAQT
jgi:hypothetical protein